MNLHWRGASALVLLILLLPLLAAPAQESSVRPVNVLIRCDDIGMCHAVNTAAREVLDLGIPVSVSVMFACPWYQEGVELLKSYPQASVGVHLTLNAEWSGYRWGPVTGREAVPSLVDSAGFFFPSRTLLFANNPKTEEVEKELRAQIERAMRSGLRIDYLDYHMGAAVQTLELRALVERLAQEYGLGISRYFGERDAPSIYAVPVERKTDSLLSILRSLKADSLQLLVFHIGHDTRELEALRDQNEYGLPFMSKHRNAELKALTSPDLVALWKSGVIRPLTYRQLIEEVGLKNMKRPELPRM